MQTCICHRTGCRGHRATCKNLFSPFTMWVSWVKLKLSGLVVSTFTTLATSLVPLNHFNHMTYAHISFLDILVLERSQISWLRNHQPDILISQSHIPGELLWLAS